MANAVPSALHAVFGYLERNHYAAQKEWNMGSIQAGDRVPDFALPSQAGQQVSLADFRGNTAVVLFSLPQRWNSGLYQGSL